MNIALLSIVLILAVASLVLKKSIASIIAFALMMLVLGIYYLTLNEMLLGLFQIFVYTGGIAVLMLFGVTLIGLEFPPEKQRPWAAAASVLFFILLVTFFWRYHGTLAAAETVSAEPKALFADTYSDFVIIFALIGSSLLYGTIRMVHVLKPKRKKKDV